ncbi:hypothetical protein TD95_000515 [Thielaviopsis punctulata]|uniref:N-acetyltransferase domain-containing protein n=1 Tax=Thielaviopsis punctulata TaxID=72032 RepID=A0A0F4Z909_9PEZI|nr:hypothetical protein TD95_000515 [Thielaviopsis punctulata]
MSNEIRISVLPPTDLSAYNRLLPLSAQSSIPRLFHDAMQIRTAVFVHEQNVPAEFEFDADDSRSCHFVAYSSSSSVPIGTLRIVPFPHAPHPLAGVSYIDNTPQGVSAAAAAAAQTKTFDDRQTALHDGREPYVKIGRMAVLKEMRGVGVGGKLVRAAMRWLKESPHAFDAALPQHTATEEKRRFKGLMCAHAQVQARKAWERWGFVVDEGMGTWNEEGIPHVGMFQRVDVEE